MTSLDRKLLRDLWSLKTQVVSIALVIACGIGGFIGSLSTHSSLLWSRKKTSSKLLWPRCSATEALIAEGLQPGERVVVYPSNALRDGSHVSRNR